MTNLLITFLASFLIWFMFLGLILLWVVDGRIKREQALHAFTAANIAWLITEFIKTVFPTLRPFMVNGLVPLTLLPGTDGSFPSAHTAAAFAMAISIWLHDKRLGSVFIVAALLVGVARVWGNVHYPVDIVGGAILGAVIAFLIERVHLKRFIP